MSTALFGHTNWRGSISILKIVVVAVFFSHARA